LAFRRPSGRARRIVSCTNSSCVNDSTVHHSRRRTIIGGMNRVPEAPDQAEEASDRSVGPGDLLALERQVCFALSIAARSVLSVYRPVLEPLGLTHPQYLVMLALWGQSPVTVKELGEMLQLDAPTLSPLLKRLEAAGLVTRNRMPEDERHLRIELTSRGRELRQEALNVPPTIIAKRTRRGAPGPDCAQRLRSPCRCPAAPAPCRRQRVARCLVQARPWPCARSARCYTGLCYTRVMGCTISGCVCRSGVRGG